MRFVELEHIKIRKAFKMKALTISCCSLYFGGGIKVLYGSCMGSLQACHSVSILQREIKQSTTHISNGV